jgi:hypothetical protein
LTAAGCIQASSSDRNVVDGAGPFGWYESASDFDFLEAFPVSVEAIDTVNAPGCTGVDQRGAPRPQTLTPGATARCDIGAIELGVNPFRGIWSPQRSGHGVELQTSGNRLLLVWYTYGDDGEPTAYQAVAPLTGKHWEATLQRSRLNVIRNPPFSGQISLEVVGAVSIDLDIDASATLGWRFNARGVSGSERIRASLVGAGVPRVEVTGLWFPPLDSGYGATIARRGDATAIAIYYYDALGAIRWALGTGSGADALQLSMTSFTGFCPDCDAAAMPVVGRAGGTLLAHFLTPRRARLDMMLTYPGTSGGTWTRSRAQFVPLSDPVDNRAAVAEAAD